MARQRKTAGGSAASTAADTSKASAIIGGIFNRAGPGSTNSSTSTSTTTSGSTTSSTKHAKPQPAKSKHQTAAAGNHNHPSAAVGWRFWRLRFFKMTSLQVLFGCVCAAAAAYICYLGYLETRVCTPFDEQRIVRPKPPTGSGSGSGANSSPSDKSATVDGDDGADRFWGSYRPGNYFGLKTRDPHSPVMGLMWFRPTALQPDGRGLRHWCEAGDGLQGYGWLQHDGRTFGVQRIDDGELEVHTSFVKFGSELSATGDWTARVRLERKGKGKAASPPRPDGSDIVSLIWYTALDEKTGGHIRTDSQTGLTGVRGRTPNLGPFQLHLHPTANSTVLHESYLSTVSGGLDRLHQLTMSQIRLVEDARSPFGRWIALPGEVLVKPAGEAGEADAQLSEQPAEPTFIATMLTGRPPFTVDITFKSTGQLSPEQASRAPGPPHGDAYTEVLATRQSSFDERFEQRFGLAKRGYSAKEQRFARAALSNMLGGIGYFYGASRVQSQHTAAPVPYWRAPLYTGVPSRSFFPRGFLWDEGFHGLLIGAWDVDIELDIMGHWLDLMNKEGWIPREQILGAEALAKVPEEFVTQRNTNANPPTFFLVLRELLRRVRQQMAGEKSADARPALKQRNMDTLERMYPRLQAWFGWYNQTQRGPVAGSYRWRGRDALAFNELNPKTLTSGLDDFPRASHPTDDERHVDLRCWLAMASAVMADLAELLGRDAWRYAETAEYLGDQAELDRLHLSPFTGTYADWGLHTDAVVLRERVQPVQTLNGAQVQHQHQRGKVRVVNKQPEPRFVDTHFGYVSLFPVLLELLQPDAPALGTTLKLMRDPAMLWSKWGLRSLAKRSPLYMAHNTETDPPYWRGQIWININYLALKALHHYAGVEGPWAALAAEIYGELRTNVVANVVGQYERTGFVWEQYSGETGEPSGCSPFTGWSALTVLAMAEQY